MAELKRQLEVLEDRIWEMEMGSITGQKASEYYQLMVDAGTLRRKIREAEQ